MLSLQMLSKIQTALGLLFTQFACRGLKLADVVTRCVLKMITALSLFTTQVASYERLAISVYDLTKGAYYNSSGLGLVVTQVTFQESI